MTIITVFAGPAGSGKTSLIASYARWLRKELFMKVGIVNLDPGIEKIPYEPVFDIRQWFTLSDIMLK